MTDRSAFDTFETRLARDLARYVAPAVDTRAASEIADAAMHPRGVAVRARSTSRRRRTLLIAVAAALVLPTAWLVAGGVSPRRVPAPEAQHPMIEELGAWTGGPAEELGSAVLTDGRVLVAGIAAAGSPRADAWSPPANAWLFDPATSRFDAAGVMLEDRAFPVMVALPGDRVLVLGGFGHGEPVDQRAEIYDAATRTFALAPEFPSPRQDCACGALNRLPWALTHATALLDGRVLVAGGVRLPGSPNGPDVAEIFDPVRGRWSQVDIACQADRSTQVLLRDGRLLLICVGAPSSEGGPVTVRARAFDPATNTFSDAGTPPGPVRSATRLADGRVLFTGFEPFTYDPATGSFERLPPGRRPSGAQLGVAIADGGALFLGDSAGLPPMRFDAATGRFQELQQPGFSSSAAAATLRDGRVLAIDDRGVRLLDPDQLPR